MSNIQDLKEAEWAFSIFNKCVPEQYRKVSVAVLVGKYSDRTPSDDTFRKIEILYERWMLDKNSPDNKFKDFLSYAKYNYGTV